MLLLVSHHPGRQAALLTCVSLMPVLLQAASLLQAKPDAHHRRSAANSPSTSADDHLAAAERRAGSSPFWLSDSEVEDISDPIRTGGNAHSRDRRDHHGHGRSHHHGRSHRNHHARRQQQEAAETPKYASYSETADRATLQQTFNFDDRSPFTDTADAPLEQTSHKGVQRRRQPQQQQQRYVTDNDQYQDQNPGFLADPKLRAHAYDMIGTGNDYQSDDAFQEDASEEEEGDEELDYGDNDEEEEEEENGDESDWSVDPPQDTRLHGRLTPCPGCQRITDREVVVDDQSGTARATGRRLSDSEMKAMLIERIKQQILAKLRLPAAPNATRRHTRLPEPLARGDPMLGDQAPGRTPGEVPLDDPDDFYGKTTQVVTFATQVNNCPAGRSIACFYFDLTGKVDASDVKTAELWVYKEPDSGDPHPQTLVFSKIASQHNNVSRVGKELGHKVVAEHQGWVRFDLKRLASQWLNNPERNLGLAVRCKTCLDVADFPVATSGDRMPFIIIHTSANHQVYRRSTNDCGERNGNECCREHFYVNFADIGWDWITWPPGYYANYCKGTCHGESPISPRYQHSNLMQQVAIVKGNEELSPCCAPRKMTPLSLLYIMDGDYIRKHLPNMAVESCSCT